MERQFCLHGADLLAIAERRDCYGAIYIAKLRCFQQRKRQNALACGKLKSICNEGVILIPADFHLVSVTLAVVHKLGFHTGFSDQSI